jgi:hypothetical protein
MASKGKTAEEQAAIASLKEFRARDAALAMREYKQQRLVLAARTEKLRALRLARERDLANNPPPTGSRKTAAVRRPLDQLRNKG